MRAAAPTLALLALTLFAVAAPAAVGQGEPVTEPMVVSPRAPEAPLRPVVDHVAVPVEVRLSCALRAAQEGPANLTVLDVPEWLVASPPSQLVELPGAAACDGGYVAAAANVTFQATAGAPSGATPPMRVTATRGAASAEANLTLLVGAFTIVEGAADSPVRFLDPGASGEVQVTVTNFGNAPVEVAFSLADDTPVTVALPEPVRLAARHAAGENSTTVPVGLVAPATPGETHRLDVVLTATAEGDAPPSESRVGLIVHVKRGGLLPGATSGVAGPGAAAAALALALTAAGASNFNGRAKRR